MDEVFVGFARDSLRSACASQALQEMVGAMYRFREEYSLLTAPPPPGTPLAHAHAHESENEFYEAPLPTF